MKGFVKYYIGILMLSMLTIVNAMQVVQITDTDSLKKAITTLNTIATEYKDKLSVSEEKQQVFAKTLANMKGYFSAVTQDGKVLFLNNSLDYYKQKYTDIYDRLASQIVKATPVIPKSQEKDTASKTVPTAKDQKPKEEASKKLTSDTDQWNAFVAGVKELKRLIGVYNDSEKGLTVAEQKNYMLTLESIKAYIDSFAGSKSATIQGKPVSEYKKYVDTYSSYVSDLISNEVQKEFSKGAAVQTIDPLQDLRIEVTVEIYADLEKQLAGAVVDVNKNIIRLIEGLGAVSNTQDKNKFYSNIQEVEKAFESQVNGLRLESIEKYYEFLQENNQAIDPLHPTADQRMFSKGAQDIIDLAIINVRKIILELTTGIIHADLSQEIQRAVTISDQEYQARLKEAQNAMTASEFEKMENSWRRILTKSWEQFKEDFPQEASKRVKAVLVEEGVKQAKKAGASASKYLPDVAKAIQEGGASLINTIEANMSQEDREKLNKFKEVVENQVSTVKDQLFAGDLSKLYNDDSKGTLALRKAIQLNFPIPLQNKSTPVKVAKSKALCEKENSYLSNRIKGIQAVLSKSFDIKQPLRVALCCSGGGARALVGTLGFYKAASRNKLLDITTYSAGLSGSAWFIASWSYMHMQGVLGSDIKTSLQNYQSMLETSLQDSSMVGTQGIYGPPMLSSELQKKLKDFILMKFAYQEPLSIIDLYGPAIANFTLNKLKDRALSAQWSNISQAAQLGSIPLPLCSAICKKDKANDFCWIETGPFEVGGPGLGYIPVWGLGSRFVEGSISSYVPETPLSIFLGIYGSAFSLSATDIIEKAIPNPKISVVGVDVEIPVSSWVNSLIAGLASEKQEYDTWLSKGITMLASTQQASGSYAEFANYSKGLNFSELQDKDTIGLIDAGLSGINVPLPILFNRKERAVDVVIIYDSNSADAKSLKNAAAHFAASQIAMPDMSRVTDKTLMENPITIFNNPNKDGYNKLLPTIIYIPTPSSDITQSPYNIKLDDKYSHITRAIDSSRPPYITLNFRYTQGDILNLTETVEAVVDSQMTVIKEVLKGVAKKKVKLTTISQEEQESSENESQNTKTQLTPKAATVSVEDID